jgi:thiol-disulfide isomerase/thioredoxin
MARRTMKLMIVGGLGLGLVHAGCDSSASPGGERSGSGAAEGTGMPPAEAAPRAAKLGLPATERQPYTMVTADWTMGKNLRSILASQAPKAEAKNQRLFLELTASWCTSCKALHESMGDPAMSDAFAGTYVVRIDVDQLGQQAVTAGFDSKDIPAFYEVGTDFRATGRMIDGNAWEMNTPAAMAPPLAAFFGQPSGGVR